MNQARKSAWNPSSPSTRVVKEEDLIHQLAWPGDWKAPLDVQLRASHAALDRLIRLGLPFRVDAGIRKFDPYEAIFFMRWAHHEFGDPLWIDAVKGIRDCASEFLASKDGKERFELTIRREFNLEKRSPGSVFHAQIPRPPEDSDQHPLSIQIHEQAGVQGKQDNARLDLLVAVPPKLPRLRGYEFSVSFQVGWRGAKIEPKRVRPFQPCSPEDLPFLASFEGPIRLTPPIQALARDLAGDSATPWDAIRSFWRFIFDRLTIGRIHPHTLDAEDPLSSTLKTGYSDCFFGSALLAALCRSRGIPARLVSGYFLYRTCQTNHFWVEAKVPPYGWVPCDLWSWTLADGDLNHEMSELFLGQLDPRLVLERLPRQQMILDTFTDRPSYTLQRPLHAETQNPGVEIIQRDLAQDTLILRDQISLKKVEL